MQWIEFLPLYAVLFTVVRSNLIEEEIQTHSKALKSKLWPTNRNLTWNLDYGPLLDDSKEIHQDIQQSFDDSSLALSKSDDDDSIMSSSDQLIQPNEMLSKQNQHSIQALYDNNINPVASAHRNRHVRSVTEKPKRNKKKSRKNKKKSKKTKKKSKTITQRSKKLKTTAKKIRKKPRNFKLTTERQPVIFQANETDKIATGVKRLQHDDTLMAFKNLSESIKAVTGLLPEKFLSALQNLSASYSTASNTIKMGLADSSAILSKFVIKSWYVIQRGMNTVDENALISIGNELNTDFKNELAKFVNLSTFKLGDIQTELLAIAAGGNVTSLLKEKDDLEIDLLRRSEEITKKSAECGENQGKLDSIKHRKNNDDKVVQNSNEDKLEMEAERNRLQAQIPDYRENVRKYRDTCWIQHTGIWPFDRRENVCQDNGERIARENLNRLLDRIQDLDRKLEKWSSVKVKKPTKVTNDALKKYKAKKVELDKELQKLQRSHDQVKKKFDDVTRQINAIYQSTGTVNIKSIQAVDELSRALENGAKSFISACNKITNHLERIQQYPYELADAVLDALKLINIADEYNDSTKIKDIKQVLGIE